MGDVEDEGRVVVDFSDLVERLDAGRKSRGPRRRRRFRGGMSVGPIRYDRHFWNRYDLREVEYTEWRLRRSAGEMLDLLDREPDAADYLLNDVLLVQPGGLINVVWLSKWHVILCENLGVDGRFPERDPPDHRLDVSTNDTCGCRLTLKLHYGAEDAAAIPLLHKIVALGTGITRVDMRIIPDHDAVPGMQDFISLARSRRTVQFSYGVPENDGRILAFHCNPMTELEAQLDEWDDKGEALAEAMLANEAPARLALSCSGDDSSAIIAPALAATTCVRELKILLPMGERDVWNAVARNVGIRALSVGRTGDINDWDLQNFWKAALSNGTVRSIDASGIYEGARNPRHIPEWAQKECSNMIATMIRSNPRITFLQYEPLEHDVHIMETRVMPIVHLNRFRPVVSALFDDGPATDSAITGRDQVKEFTALIGSPLVRRHPELLYVLLKAGRDYLLPTTAVGGSTSHRRRVSARLLARKRRGRSCS